ncbi:MAG: N-acetylmuramoyl-L-alanine amidase [Lachnospiraceae bacterium]|nr:N-acetylmuramoyl-L-alanine amidase [Lachnospiraceae bacterium]
MDQKLLKRTAGNSVLLMIFMLIFSAYVTKENTPGIVMAGNEEAFEETSLVGVEENEEEPEEAPEPLPQQDPVSMEEEMVAKMGDRYLIIPKNGSLGNAELSIDEDYLYKVITLKATGVNKLTWDNMCVRRYNEGREFTGEADTAHLEVYKDEYLYDDEEPADLDTIDAEDLKIENEEKEGPEDLVRAVNIEYDEASEIAKMSLTTDHLYIPVLYEDDANYYIDLKKPKEVYDKIVVFDAGHGGKHPGTMSNDRKYLEKDFNLEIIKKIKEKFDAQTDIKVFYTRMDDSSVYLLPRVTLANEAQADYFVSVHNNAYYNKWAYGTEVLYNELLETKGNVDSKELATLLLNEVVGRLNNRNRGLRMGSTTFIIGHSQVPVALLELGYLTNPDDLAMLQDEKNIELIADGIYTAILKAYEEEGK